MIGVLPSCCDGCLVIYRQGDLVVPPVPFQRRFKSSQPGNVLADVAGQSSENQGFRRKETDKKLGALESLISISDRLYP